MFLSKRVRNYIFVLFSLIFPVVLFAQSNNSDENIYFTSYPALTPDGSTVVFSYDSDLWKVPSKGGEAVRLTGMQGTETRPRISPDGKWIAFTSNQYGNEDVYVMPVDGGKIRRLTYYQSADQVDTWSWDSKYIYFISNRYNRFTEYKVNINGGTPERLFPNYFNTIHNVALNPKTGEIFFNQSWESYMFTFRKRYKGPFNPDIQSYNPKTGVYKRYTHYVGKDFWTTIDREGHIYFVSDQGNNEYNLYTFRDDKKTQLTDFKTSIKNPNVSANGTKVVFEKDYQLFIYDVASGKAHKIPVTAFQNNTLAESQDFNVNGKISNFDVSPDNKKLAFVSRGELFVSDIKGKFIRKIVTRESGRVSEVAWLNDSKNLIFNQTVDGYQNWFTIAADGLSKAKQITNEHHNDRDIVLNPKRTEAVYLSGRDELRIIDLKTLKSKTIVKDEFWGYQNSQPRFSPNGEYVVFTAYRNFEQDIFIHNLKSGKTIDLTKTGVTETDPFWSPDGKYIYFVSDLTHPAYPFGLRNAHVYRMPLEKFEKPFRSTEFNDLFKTSDKKKKDSTDSVIKIRIDTLNIMQRIKRVGPGFGRQYTPYVIKKDEKTMVIYPSNHNKGTFELWMTTMQPFEKSKTEVIKGTKGAGYAVAEAKKHYYMLLRGSIYKFEPGGPKVDKIDMNYTFRRNLRAEFDQMYTEVWANLNENYYSPTMNHTNWTGIKNHYAHFLPYIHSRANLRTLISDMLGELDSSHIGFYSQGKEEKEYYSSSSMATGIVWDNQKPFVVDHVVKNSPMDKYDIHIEKGDQLIKVDDHDINLKLDRESYFTRPSMDQEMSLTFKRKDTQFQVKIHPESYGAFREQLYNEWIDNNKQRVDRESDGKIGYVYMKNMTNPELQHFLIYMTSQGYKKDGLILDLRYNTGGNVHDEVLHFLEQRPYLKWKYRDGKFTIQPNFAPEAKPIVLLVNQQTLSDAEVTSAGFKALKLGTIVGTHTYKWIIFTSGKGLVDGSFYRLPSWGVYTLSGKNLEHNGVEPDVKIDNTFLDRIHEKDPQLDKAVSIILNKLK